ncbi:aldehyde dehydrogenase family protein, partial [Pseudophaeobacter sp.]
MNQLRKADVAPQKLFLEGSWERGSGTPLEVTSPIEGAVLTTLEGASATDVERAVASARRAYDDGRWAGQSPAARKKVLHRIADRIEAEAVELAVLGVRDNGTE